MLGMLVPGSNRKPQLPHIDIFQFRFGVPFVTPCKPAQMLFDLSHRAGGGFRVRDRRLRLVGLDRRGGEVLRRIDPGRNVDSLVRHIEITDSIPVPGCRNTSSPRRIKWPYQMRNRSRCKAPRAVENFEQSMRRPARANPSMHEHPAQPDVGKMGPADYSFGHSHTPDDPASAA